MKNIQQLILAKIKNNKDEMSKHMETLIFENICLYMDYSLKDSTISLSNLENSY